MSTTVSKFSAVKHCRESILDYDRVIVQVRKCPNIASLRSINDALTKLTARSQSPVYEIADIVRRDLSLTARLLRLVNSVFGGLSVKISSIEEAIFFLGMRQIRQLAMTTRVIDEVEETLQCGEGLKWEQIWRQSIGTGILTREILSMTCGGSEDDTYYVCGLLHDIGKLVMLNVFPEEFAESRSFKEKSSGILARKEKAEFGWNHAEIGALYLEVNGLPREIVEAVLFHHEPSNAYRCRAYAAGIQVADYISRFGGCESGFENVTRIAFGDWEHLEGWGILFTGDRAETQFARASVLNSIERLPSILQGLI
ncbi:MAG: HDOD domain-containing protein [Puniceicoccaceae bacterium]